MVMMVLILILLLGAAVGWVAYNKERSSTEQTSGENPSEHAHSMACLMLKNDLNEMKHEFKTFEEASSRLDTHCQQSMTQINQLMTDNKQLITRTDAVLNKAKIANQQCFDVINARSELKPSLERLKLLCEQIKALDQSPLRVELEHLLTQLLTIENAEREGLNALENQTHVIEYDLTQLTQGMHQQQRSIWETQSGIEQLSHQGAHTAQSLRHYTQALVRANDVIDDLAQPARPDYLGTPTLER